MVCQECDEHAEATHFCEDCSLTLCDDCTKHHRKSKKSKGHALQTMAEALPLSMHALHGCIRSTVADFNVRTHAMHAYIHVYV